MDRAPSRAMSSPRVRPARPASARRRLAGGGALVSHLAVALAALLLVAGCGSDGKRASSPTPAATATPTGRIPEPLASPTPTQPVLCSVFGDAAGACETPTPGFAACSGATLTTCAMYCGGVNNGCCPLTTPVPQCFNPANGTTGTMCDSDASAACVVVSTPTPTITATSNVSGTPTQTASPGATLQPCTGSMLTTCVDSCGGGSGGCCLKSMPPQCFNLDGGISSTLCSSDPGDACAIVPTPTPSGTATATTTGTPTATPTATDTPVGGIPTPTLPPNTCDMACNDTGPPDGCTALPPNAGGLSGAPPNLIVDTCLIVGSGSYAYTYVNVIDGGTLYFADDGATIDFRASSILVQQGGRVKAGSWCCPFGSYGGQLDIGLWGTDPTDQGRTPTPSVAAITCVDASGTPAPCFSHELTHSPHYCTVRDSDDPCSSATPPSVGDNALFEGNHDHGAGGLPFDGGSSFGYKVFAVTYGGSLELFGAKGVAPENRSDPRVADTACAVPPVDQQSDPAAWAALSGTSWTRLSGDAAAQSTRIALDRAVDWEQGDRLVVTSTDWYAGHSEEVLIAGIESGTASFALSVPLDFDHSGTLYDVTKAIPDPPSANEQIETRAAVGLLSRDIRVYSLGDTYDAPFPAAADCGYQGDSSGNATTPPNCYFGGQVLARQGFRRFQLQGVEFSELGQGGRLAHYPVHFHMVKSTAYTNAFVKDSSIADSMNRFVTIHATHDVTVARNVGFRSVGHGFYVEDGSEIDNLLCHNLAVSVQGSLVEYFQAQAPDSPTYRFSPPILPSVSSTAPSSGPPYGSDSYFPVGFWLMNTWNEVVGNQVVGVGGFGSCYWLLGSGVSGPSQQLQWSTSTTTPAGYADYNLASARQAPLKRFRGNGCSTSQYALQTTTQVDPPVFSAAQYGYTPAVNPYAITQDMLPLVGGDYLPVLNGGVGCATQRTSQDTGENATSCALTLLDRFTTSFNWAPIDFGAIWLRPQFFAFTNGAVTDQLFGGLTFVSGGAWTQAPAGYFTITQDSLYVGGTHPDAPDAGRFGPAFDIAACGSAACPLPSDGTALPIGGFQPKRLINIYDGPFFADGNAFADAPALACDPTAVSGGNPQCGIYMSTVQPASCGGLPSVAAATGSDGMCVIDATVGWKQPNGFYYPPAFAFENTAFDDQTVRHNVIDIYDNYVQGTLTDPGNPTTYDPLRTYTGVTPIDASTILNDLDGTFTGTCWGDDCDSQPVGSPQRRTASVSANHFFDAPSQTPECLSFGVQTSPSDFLTSVIAPLTSDGSAIDPTPWGTYPAVPIYRQRLLSTETACAGAVCDGATWACEQAAFMMGAENGQAPYLTADDGVYYIDTDTAGQTTSCIPNANFSTAPFSAGSSYVIYQLFSKADAKTTYQLYTGSAPAAHWVWVQPHLTQSGLSNSIVVTPITDTTLVGELDKRVTQHADGVLEVQFDNSLIADQFTFTARDDDDKCIPRDACAIGPSGEQCVLAANFAEPDLKATVGSICEKWATRVAGTTPISAGLSLSDCPASGCLGYAFTLPSSWVAESYADSGANHTTCFPADAAWDRPLQTYPADGVCPMPPAPSGFCPAPPPTPITSPTE